MPDVSNCLLEKTHSECDKLKNAVNRGLMYHSALTVLSKCIVPSINYGPVVDEKP